MMKPRPLAVIRNRRLNSVALLDPLRSVQFRTQPPTQFSPRPLVHLHRPLPCHTTPCHAMPYHSIACHTMPCEHEVAVQTATQPGNCSPPPGTYRSGAIEHCLLRFQAHVRFHVCLRLSWPSTSVNTSTLLAVGITPTTTAGFSKGLPALLTEFTGRLVYF